MSASLTSKAIANLAKNIGSTGQFSASPLKRIGQLVRGNFAIFRPDYYEHITGLTSGRYGAKQAAKSLKNREVNLIKEAIKNFTKETTSPKYWGIRQKTGITLASNKVILNNLHKMKEASKHGNTKKAKKTYHRALKEIVGQLKGQGISNIASGVNTYPAALTKELWVKPHNLDNEMLSYVLKTQMPNAGSRIKPIVFQAQTRIGSNFANDMSRAETTKLVDYYMSLGARRNIPLPKLQKLINDDLKKGLLGQLKKHKHLKNATDSQLKMIQSFLPSPRAYIDKNGKLIINDVIMSGDFTAAYAPITTVINKDYTYKRVLSDMFDGGNLSNFEWKDIVNPKNTVSKLFNRAWNFRTNKRVIQVSRQQEGTYLHTKKNPVMLLKKMKIWKSLKQRKNFKEFVSNLSKTKGVSEKEIENQLLVKLQKEVEMNLAKGYTPFDSIQRVESQLKNPSTVFDILSEGFSPSDLKRLKILRNVKPVNRKTSTKYSYEQAMGKKYGKPFRKDMENISTLNTRETDYLTKQQFLKRKALQLGLGGSMIGGGIYATKKATE